MPRTLKWIITIVSGAAVFAGTWWLCEAWLDRSSGDAIGIAAIPSALLVSLLAWWAGRDKPAQPGDVSAEAVQSSSNTITSDDVSHAVQARDVHGGIHFHAPAVEVTPSSADQVVTGLIPHQPPNFQVPHQVAALAEMTGEVCVVCAVTGQRGVGKTQVAAAYARRRVQDGWLVAWIGAETDDQIKAGMVELADRLELNRPEDTAEMTAARVRDHLQTRQGHALLVFDNVVSLDAIQPCLPAAGHAQVVITSTARGSQLGREVPVDVFDLETALRFLRETTGIDDDAAASELAREVGCLPLALGQAAARIRAGWDYPTYLEHFRQFPAEKHLSRRAGDPYPLGAATAILIALEPFQSSEVAQLLSLLSPDGVSRKLLDASADDELMRLHEASLVEFAGRSSVIMHRLVQRVVRDYGRESGTYQTWVRRAAVKLTRAVDLINDAWADRNFTHELVRQIEALWGNLTTSDSREVREATIVLRLQAAHFLADMNEFSRSAHISQAAYLDCVAELEPDHPIAVTARGIVVQVRADMPEQFTENLQKDFSGIRSERGLEDDATIFTAIRLAHHYLMIGRTGDAVELLEQTAEPWRHRPRDTEPVFALLDELAVAYTAAGRAEDSIALLEQNIQDRTALSGEEGGLPMLFTKTTLAEAYDAAGRLPDAAAMFDQVFQGRRRIQGLDHPATISAARSLARALVTCGELEKARAVLHWAVDVARQVLGNDHESTVSMVKALDALEAIRQD